MGCNCTANNWAGTKHVYGVGPKNARIFIVGEAPGAEEDQSGTPFSGGSGRILDTWLAKVGISRAACHIDNVVSHRPPNNDISQADLRHARESLLQRIQTVSPNLILLLGNTPLQLFVAGTISDWRGSHFPIQVGDQTFQAVAAYHPAFIMRQRRMWDVTLHDLARAKELSRTAGYKEPEVHYTTNPSIQEVREACELSRQADNVAVDIETDFGFAAIDLVGLSWQESYAISIPTVEEDYIYELFAFLRKAKGITTHDSIFDAYHMRRFGFPCPSPIHNTLLYSHLLYPHLPHDLGFLGSVYTPYAYWKDQMGARKEWYNCRDTDATLIIVNKQIVELKELGLL